MTKKYNDTQILGALPLSFGQACINFHFFIAEERPFLENIKADEWYPLQKFSKILNTIREKYPDPAPIFERIGIEMMNQWYSHGPGKQIIKKGIDFLHFQTSSEGYYSVIRGKPDQIGDFSLLSLDEDNGTAVVKSTTPFDRDMERGVLIGGLGTCGDLVYVKVDNSDNEDIFHIHFLDSQLISANRASIPDAVDLATLYWKHKMLEDDFRRHRIFWKSTNDTLSLAFEKLENQDEQLHDRTKELLQINTQLNQEIAERKRAEQELQKLVSVVKYSDELVNLATMKGQMIFLNQAGCKMLGIDPDDVEKTNIMEVIPESFKELVENQLLPSLIKGETWEGELQYRNLKTRKLTDVHAMTFTVKNPETNKPQFLANISKDISGRKKAEEELKMYQVMIESAQDAIFFKDLKSRYISANDKTLEAFGLSRKEVIGKSDYELMPDQQEAKQNVQDDQTVFKSGKTTEFHKHMTGADNKEYWFQAIKVPQFDNDGKVKGLVGIARDITDLKRVENALRESEALYHSLVENLPQYIFRKDMEGKYTFVNQQFCFKEGKPPEAFLGKTDVELYPESGSTSI
jgi:PAS domain S-box-containing protein